MFTEDEWNQLLIEIKFRTLDWSQFLDAKLYAIAIAHS